MESKLCKIKFPNNFEMPKDLNLEFLKGFRFGNSEKPLKLRQIVLNQVFIGLTVKSEYNEAEEIRCVFSYF